MEGYGRTYLLYLRQVPMFSACTDAELERIGEVSEIRTLEAGTTVVSEGDVGDEFYVIANGAAVVSRDGKEVARLKGGDFFGELALLDPWPRDATVVAEDALTVGVLGRDAFLDAVTTTPSLTLNLLRGMARRLHVADARIYGRGLVTGTRSAGSRGSAGGGGGRRARSRTAG
jgi:CRP-like cAMP-binding protein